MRIRKLELQNFKGFAGHHSIDFQAACKNLLMLGENGSGKTSIVKALEGLLDASRQDVEFQRNMFCDPSAAGLVKIELEDGSSFVWNEGSRVTDHADLRIANASKAKHFLDYKGLLRTYFLQGQRVNVFDLLLEDILADVVNDLSGKPFSENWGTLQKLFLLKRRTDNRVAAAQQAVSEFNAALDVKLKTITKRANEILKLFESSSSLSFDLKFEGLTYVRSNNRLEGKEIGITTTFHDSPLEQHHLVLNEARLSAIAISLFFAVTLETPVPPDSLSILALDDVLIGLDMEHRLPVLDTLKQYFSGYQILLLTYDPVWFDIFAQRVSDGDWRKVRFYRPSKTDLETSVIEGENLLESAKRHLGNGDLKAAAIYARSAFEICLQKFCEKKKVPVRFNRQLKRLDSDDFLDGIKNWQTASLVVIDTQLETDIKAVRSVVLNQLSHAQAIALTTREVQDAINVVARLEQALL